MQVPTRRKQFFFAIIKKLCFLLISNYTKKIVSSHVAQFIHSNRTEFVQRKELVIFVISRVFFANPLEDVFRSPVLHRFFS